jgi:hypothetical protein
MMCVQSNCLPTNCCKSKARLSVFPKYYVPRRAAKRNRQKPACRLQATLILPILFQPSSTAGTPKRDTLRPANQ